MSIHVTDFKWEKGKNDLEYIALLEKNLAVMKDNFKECSKLARNQYNKGSVDGYNQALEDFTSLLIDNLVDFGEGQNVIMAIDRGRIARLKKQLVK